MKKSFENARLYVRVNDRIGGYDIFMNAFGKPEFVLHYRKSNLLKKNLKEGMTIRELDSSKKNMARRYNRRNASASQRLVNSVDHLLIVAEEVYEDSREAYEERISARRFRKADSGFSNSEAA